MKGKIYKISNSINNKVYIGKTYSSLEKRMSEHLRDSKKEKNTNRPLYKAFIKYGYENFHIEELGEFEEGILEEKEMEFIEKYNSYYEGYNATIGGDGKRYFEYSDEEVIKYYLENHYVNKTAEHFNCSEDTVRNILRSSKVEITKHFNNGFSPNSIRMIFGEEKKDFPSVTAAAQWIYENSLSSSGSVVVIRKGISRAVNGSRKSYLNRKWVRI